MAKARPVKIGDRLFEKVGDASTFFTEMLGRYQPGDVVSAIDATDLGNLVARHSEVNEKVGEGISYFVVDHAPEPHPGKCFWVIQKSGTKIDFGITHCLLPHPTDPRI